jgi:NADH-quinone oxidoreductase subunit N
VLDNPKFYWLAIVAIVNSVISLYYYARVFRNMYLREAEENRNGRIILGPVVVAWSLIFVIPNILFGLKPDSIIAFAQKSIQMFIR